MTLGEKIKHLDPETMVNLRNDYGVFWTGKAKFVFNAVSYKAWNSADIDVEVIS